MFPSRPELPVGAQPQHWLSTLHSGYLRGQFWRYSTRIRTAVATALVLAVVIGWIWPDGRPPLQELWVADRNLPAGSVLSREDVWLGLDSLGLPGSQSMRSSALL